MYVQIHTFLILTLNLILWDLPPRECTTSSNWIREGLVHRPSLNIETK